MMSRFSHFRGQTDDAEVRRKKFLVATTDKKRIRFVMKRKLREITNWRRKTRSAVCSRKVVKHAAKAARIPVYSQNRSATVESLEYSAATTHISSVKANRIR